MIITASKYAKKVGLSLAYIVRCLQVQKESKTIELPGASRVEKIGNTWCVTVNGKLNADAAKEELKPLYKQYVENRKK